MVDTVMRWYHQLIAEKYDGPKHREYAGRPPITEEIVNLIIRFKAENPRWGYKKIRDQVVYLGYTYNRTYYRMDLRSLEQVLTLGIDPCQNDMRSITVSP